MAYQRVRTKSSKASPPKISQELTLYFNLYTNGQHSGFDKLEKKMRETENQKMAMLSEKIWERVCCK